VDPQRHASLSASRRGGVPDDYSALHGFLDTTKELCADNRHRLLHNPWGMRRVVVPLFGPRLSLSGGGSVLTKDVVEQDHVLADFAGRFVPTLADFVNAIAPEPGEIERFRSIHAPYQGDDDVMRLLLSPFAVTGRVRALLVTHSTWFLTEVLPRLHPRVGAWSPRGVPPEELFARMRFQVWMDNGAELPPSSPRSTSMEGMCRDS
jgi:hypothetical protein